jgi:hypothetical protein
MTLAPKLALAAAIGVLAAHLAFIVWVIAGALFTRGRRWLAVTHILCLIYGMVIEVAPWPCPLTVAENWFEVKAGRTPYQGPFLLHYLDALVYPQVAPSVLIWGAAVVVLANAVVYWRRWRVAPASRREPPAAGEPEFVTTTALPCKRPRKTPVILNEVKDLSVATLQTAGYEHPRQHSSSPHCQMVLARSQDP